jgi:hypothetical protein
MNEKYILKNSTFERFLHFKYLIYFQLKFIIYKIFSNKHLIYFVSLVFKKYLVNNSWQHTQFWSEQFLFRFISSAHRLAIYLYIRVYGFHIFYLEYYKKKLFIWNNLIKNLKWNSSIFSEDTDKNPLKTVLIKFCSDDLTIKLTFDLYKYW